jgi:hypothetical protein
MIDSYMLLAPLVVLPIILLLVFVGCGLEQSGGLEHMTVSLRWWEPLRPDIAKQQFNANAIYNNTGHPDSQEVSVLGPFFLNLPDGFPLVLDLGANFYPPLDEMVTVNLVCRLMGAADGEVIFSVLHEGEPRTREDFGSQWNYDLIPVHALDTDEIVGYDLQDRTGV